MNNKVVKFITLMLYSLANNGKLSGRADGNVYARNGVVRGFKVPRLVQNAYTANARVKLGLNSSDWNSLSDAERLTWINMTGYTTSDRFGRTIPLVAKQLFVSLNNNLRSIVQPTISEAPFPELVDQITGLTSTGFDLSAVEFPLAFTGTPTSENVIHLLFATAPLSAGSYRPGKSKYRMIGAINSGTPTGEDIANAYVVKFGVPPLDSKIFIKLIPIDKTTGNSGVPIIAATATVA